MISQTGEAYDHRRLRQYAQPVGNEALMSTTMTHKEVNDLLRGLFIAGFVAGCRHMREQLRAAPKPCEVDAEVGEVWFEALTKKNDETDDETVERIAEQMLERHAEQESLEFLNDVDDRVIVQKTARPPRE